YVEAMRAAAEVMQMDSLSVPILIVQGTADSVTSAESVQVFFERLRCADKHCIVYKGFRHELHNETNRLSVMKAYLDWMKAHSP
ncbi:MAG: alpha/beta hydrolase, partial [Verrucomicrobia bacterium]|nr:alpha/beta hydrolase [Verrucomicrobiota bacterium]